MTSSPSGRRALPALIVAALALGAALLAAPPAVAHDQLVSTDPAAGSTVAALPAEITLTYSAELLGSGEGTEVQVTDAAGTSIADGPAVIDGTRAVQALVPGATGDITVLWRVVSSDGHPISGDFAFTVAGAPAPTPTPTATSAPSPTATTDASPTAEPSASASEAPAPDSDGASPLPWILLVVVILVAAAVILVLVLSRRRARGPGGTDATPGR